MAKRRHFGNIRKTSAGRYQVRYPGPGGEPRKGPRTFATKADANRYLSEVETELNRGTWRDPSITSVTFAEYSSPWLEYRQLAPRTRDLYADLLRMHLLPVLGKYPLGKITPAEVRRWHSVTARRLRESSVSRGGDGSTRLRQGYSLLRAILNTAKGDGLIIENPCQIPGAGQVRSSERDFLSLAQVLSILECCDPWFRPVATLTFWAQLRKGEVLAVCREDIDLTSENTGNLRVRRQLVRTAEGFKETEPKWSSIRTLMLPRQAVESVRAHLDANPRDPTDRLFTRADGSPLYEYHVQTAWNRARVLAGIPSATFHDLRHAGLTLVAQTGVTTRELMGRGGHSTPRAALIYQHVDPDRDKVVADMLSAYAEKIQGS